MGTAYFLNVGYGDASVITTDKGVILVDCHDIESYSSLLPADKKIHTLFITHQHYDHFDGMEYLLNEGFTVDHLVYSPYVRTPNDTSVDYVEWNIFNSYKERLLKRGAHLYAPHRQDTLIDPWGHVCGLPIWILGPPSSVAQHATELHDASLVILMGLGIRRCMFSGDASDKSLDWIAKREMPRCNDILHASNHGCLNGASLAFLRSCQANYAVISTKEGVRVNAPDPAALERYSVNIKAKVFRTDLEGCLDASF